MLQVIEDEPSEYLIGESEWRSQMRVSRKEYLCQHDWSYDETTAADCRDCKLEARAGNRIDCRKCKLIICSLCTYHCFKISWPSTIRTQMKKTDWKSLSALQSNLIQKFIRRENELEEEVKNLRQQISGMEELAIIQEAPSEYERELTEVQQENAFLKLMNEKQQKEIEALKQEKQLLLELGEINKRELMDLKTRLLVPSSLPVLTFDEYYVNAAPQRNNLLNIKIYSKFDLKSGFHQVMMEPESIPRTAFWAIDGLYEWLVMSFGLKNAPAIFQRKMDNCFRGPLYSKTSVKGERRMNTQDWKIIEQIKQQVQNLPDLEIPPPDAIILLETDGCMEGWGGICKWKTSKGEPRTSEKICAYASGRFLPVKSTIDAECACGRDAALLVSHTSRNPGRHFYKCSTDTCHSWYWADLIENYVQQRLNMEAPLAQEPINWVNIEQHGYWDNDPVWEEPGLGEPEVINDDEANSEIDDPTEDSSLFHQHLD
ncbi:hypothetical protein ZIOFF_007703 [Zingiber officinale]|uniref:GRF-type domain-containing protein n=1 Tax=Zingiber officinale TaxID=94328 RepID=A0A8J5I2B3_ZINOF|nr:hypothetical protein ZIOFF_007703 [Zingiber officinale]